MAKIVFFGLFPKDILKKTSIFLAHWRKSTTFAALKCCGTLAEWLGNGLQNRVQQFESARYLPQPAPCSLCRVRFFVAWLCYR